MRILVLEDNPDRIREFNARFNEHGWTATFVKRAQDAIDLISENDYDLIFLDHDLAGGPRTDPHGKNTGSEVARYIQRHPDRVEDSTIIIHSINTSAAQYMKNLIPQAHLLPFIWKEDKFSAIKA